MANGRVPALVGLIRHPDAGAILFDTGYSDTSTRDRAFPGAALPLDHRSRCPQRMPQTQLARHGIALHEVRFVFASHLHADHRRLRDLPRAAIWCATTHCALRGNAGRLTRLRKATLSICCRRFRARRIARSNRCRAPRCRTRARTGRRFDLLDDAACARWRCQDTHAGTTPALRHEDDRDICSPGCDLALSDKGEAAASAWPTRLLPTLGRAHDTLMRLRRVLRDSDDSRCVLPSHCAGSYARLPDAMRGTP